MVNSFLVCSDFSQSAKLLDPVRLPNQRREGIMLLNSVIKLKMLGNFTGYTLPHNPYEWYDWVRLVIRKYNQSKYYLAIRGNNSKSDSMNPNYSPQWIAIPKTGSPNSELILVPKTGIVIKVDSHQPKDDIIPARPGYIYHPCVLMWLGHENTLREYIDIHIEESIKRGIENNIPRYPYRGNHKPEWVYDQDVLIRYRSKLIAKEIQRNEPSWYVKRKEFLNIPYDLPYFWPYAIKVGKQTDGIADADKRYAKHQ